MVDVDLSIFPSSSRISWPCPCGSWLGAESAPSKVKKTIWPKPNASAVVALGDGFDLQRLAGGLSGILLEIVRGQLFDEDGRDFPIFEDLVFDVVLPILFEPGMEGQAEQAIEERDKSICGGGRWVGGVKNRGESYYSQEGGPGYWTFSHE